MRSFRSRRISLSGLTKLPSNSSRRRWVQLLFLITAARVSITAAASALQQPHAHQQEQQHPRQEAQRLLRGGGGGGNTNNWRWSSLLSSDAVAEEPTTTRQLSSPQGGHAVAAPWPVIQPGDYNSVMTVPTRKQHNNVNNKQAAADAGGTVPLVIDVIFLVSSISNSPSQHNVDIADLQKMLEAFAELVVEGWAYRRRNLLLSKQEMPLGQQQDMMIWKDGQRKNNDDMEQRRPYLRNSNSNSNNNPLFLVSAEQQTQTQTQTQQQATSIIISDLHRQRRRLQQTLSLVQNSVQVSDQLETSTDCTVSVSQAASGFPHCHLARGSFQVLPTSTNTPRVCRNMQTTILDNGADYFDQALDNAGLTSTGMIISPPPTETFPRGAYEDCQAMESTTPPATSAPAAAGGDGNNIFNQTGTSDPPNTTTAPTPNNNPSTNPPTSTATTTPPFAITTTTPPAGAGTTQNSTTAPTQPLQGGGNATTTAPGSSGGSTNGTSAVTPAPGTVAPSEEGSFVDEWLALLNGDKEDEDPAESGNAWLDTVEGATSDQGGDTTPAPAPAYNNSQVTADIEKERQAYWDDSMLDQVIIICLICLGSLFVLVCCCYWGDAAWIRYRLEQLYTADEEHFHDGRWYYDEKHRFPRADCAGKPPPGEFQQLSEGFEEGSIESESEEDDEDSMFMSDSEESDDDFDFEEDHDFTDGTGQDESGDFYVDYDEEDEDEDVFDESESSEPEEDESMYTGDPSMYGGDEDYTNTEYTDTNRFEESQDSDFFNDESDKEQAKPHKRHK